MNLLKKSLFFYTEERCDEEVKTVRVHSSCSNSCFRS